MAESVPVSVSVNGTTYAREVEPRDLLVYFLREELGLTGTHVGCDTSQCGACTVLIDDRPVKSCTMFAVQADGRQLTTDRRPGAATASCTPLQEAFWNEHGLQCGFCTPGFIMTATALLQQQSATRPKTRSARAWKATCAAARATRTSSRPCRSPAAPRQRPPRNRAGAAGNGRA